MSSSRGAGPPGLIKSSARPRASPSGPALASEPRETPERSWKPRLGGPSTAAPPPPPPPRTQPDRTRAAAMSSILDVNTLYQNLLNLSLSEEQEVSSSGPHLSRRHSACSSDTPYSSSRSSSGDPSPVWPLRSHWSPGTEQPRPVGEPGRRPPLRPDRSVSLIEGKALPPPPGFPPLRLPPLSPAPSSRYKTELCRTYSETGRCKYGSKCQFAHGPSELRSISRHPKYKTELCHKFYLHGECPYGSRCHFIHYPEEAQLHQGSSSSSSPQLLRQSISYSGVPTACRSSPLPSMPDPASFARASSVSPPPVSADLLSPTFGPLNSDPISVLSALGNPLLPTSAGGGCCSCRCGKSPPSLASPSQTRRDYFPAAPAAPAASALPRTPSANSLSDPDCYSSSSSLSGSDSPVFDLQAPGGLAGGAHRLPIFNRLSVSE
uniref:mRNA decay activator protein ZFP36 n=1 Tax=Pogona vitticeps TaxID=103695 RepID=A0A6J0T280_9SAUR